MYEIKIFDGHNVEVIEFNGQVLFNPYNVGECLDLNEVTVRRHIQSMNDKQVCKLTNSDVQNLNIRKLNNAGENFLTESGVYKLAFKSHKESAECFQDWVTDEVLPSIHRTGSYIHHQLSPMEMIAAMANNAVETERRLKEAESRIAETSSKLDQALDIFTETLAEPDWKHCMNHRISTICERYHLSHQKTRGDLYLELELIANCNLNSRVARKKKRLKQAGAKYKDAQAVTKLEVIADDQKLKPIFDGIVKKFEAKYIQGDNVQLRLVEIP